MAGKGKGKVAKEGNKKKLRSPGTPRRESSSGPSSGPVVETPMGSVEVQSTAVVRKVVDTPMVSVAARSTSVVVPTTPVHDDADFVDYEEDRDEVQMPLCTVSEVLTSPVSPLAEELDLEDTMPEDLRNVLKRLLDTEYQFDIPEDD